LFDRKEHNKRYYQMNKDSIKAKDAKWREDNPERWAYLMQRQHAKERGIDFDFDFDTWTAWWGDDFVDRGDQPHQLVMARVGDEGPYHPENVYKSTALDNATLGNKKAERLRT
jgi:sugar/nucleoside kinase (ribokinase family)